MMVEVCTRELIAYAVKVLEMSMLEHGIERNAASDKL